MFLHRVLVTVLICLSGPLLSASPGLAGPPPTPRGELRVVDTSAGQWAYVTFNIFEHLIEVDRDGEPSRAVAYDPSATTVLLFKDASVSDQHRSVRARNR